MANLRLYFCYNSAVVKHKFNENFGVKKIFQVQSLIGYQNCFGFQTWRGCLLIVDILVRVFFIISENICHRNSHYITETTAKGNTDPGRLELGMHEGIYHSEKSLKLLRDAVSKAIREISLDYEDFQ